ncbi:hypothetical protein Angca_000926, partial [Angiostrongylus cantonensis]
KTDPERLPDDYVNEIKQLLDRHKTVMNEYDFPNDHIDEETVTIDHSLTVTESENGSPGSPMQIRSCSNSVKPKKVRNDIQDCRASHKALDVCSNDKIVNGSRRRSWSGLNDSVFDPVQLPLSLDASVQTIVTLHRANGLLKIETTV